MAQMPEWERIAEAARTLATVTKDGETRYTLLAIARSYELLIADSNRDHNMPQTHPETELKRLEPWHAK